MKRSGVIGACLAATVAVLSGPSHATTISMNFDALQNAELVNDYYDGGSGSLGSGPGPNYGVTFANAYVLNEYTNNEGLLVTPPNSITFLTGTGAIMNVAAGFTTGFSFNYSAPSFSGLVTIWSGLDATGTELASFTLPTTSNGAGTPGCGGHDYCPVFPYGVSFLGTAMSVNFGGTADYVVYDDITLGSTTPGTPEPSTWGMMLLGFAGMAALSHARFRRRRAAVLI